MKASDASEVLVPGGHVEGLAEESSSSDRRAAWAALLLINQQQGCIPLGVVLQLPWRRQSADADSRPEHDPDTSFELPGRRLFMKLGFWIGLGSVSVVVALLVKVSVVSIARAFLF